MLDKIDHALLAALEKNARASVVALAREVGLSRSATQDRLARLEQIGAVAGYTIVRGDQARRPVEALLMITNHAAASCKDVVPSLRQIAGVSRVDSLAGKPDLAAHVAAASSAQLEDLVTAVRALEGVAAVTTHVVMTSDESSAQS